MEEIDHNIRSLKEMLSLPFIQPMIRNIRVTLNELQEPETECEEIDTAPVGNSKRRKRRPMSRSTTDSDSSTSAPRPRFGQSKMCVKCVKFPDFVFLNIKTTNQRTFLKKECVEI